jgi:hypothetical protein
MYAKLLLFGVTTTSLTVALSMSSIGASDLHVSNVRVLSRGFDEGGEFCSNFSLSVAQAREFLRRASKLSGADYHQLAYIPCYVRGTGEQAGRPVRWEIRAGGTGFITTDAGNLILIGCKYACDYLLK